MTELLKVVLSLSLSGSLLILLLLAAKPLYRNRLSKRWQYAVWLLVAARLLLPFSPARSPVGDLFRDPLPAAPAAYTLPRSGAAAPPALSDAPTAGTFPRSEGEAPPAPAAPPAEQGSAPALTDLLGALWLGGALLLMVQKVTAYRSFVGCLRAGWEPVADPALLDLLANTAEEAGVRRPVELCVAPRAASPMLVGLGRPAVVLPSAGLPEEDLRCIFRHELAHCRGGDLLRKWLVQLALCVHWFNPLVWLMVRETDRACELCCDERVIRTLDDAGRRAYGDTLLRAVGRGSGLKSSLASVTLHESGRRLKERLAAIMGYRQPTGSAAVFSALLTAALVLGTVTAGAYTGPAEAARGGTDTGGDQTPPAAVKGDPASGWRYTEEGYYQSPYLFELGWNVNESAWEQYPGRELVLPEGSAVTVFFGEDCRERMTDEAALQALAVLLGRLRAEAAGEGFSLRRVLVLSVREVEGAGPAELAELLYTGDDLSGFAAVFPILGEDAQRRYLERCYEDGRLPLFAACINRLPAGDPLPDTLTEQAYRDGAVSFFSVLAGRMTAAERDRWLTRAAEDRRSAFLSVLLNAAGRYGEEEQLKKELEARQAEEYAAWGITQSGWNYYYQGQLVRVLMDRRSGGSFHTLGLTPGGAVDIKILRDDAGAIIGVAYMTAAEVAELELDPDMDLAPDTDIDPDMDPDPTGSTVTVPVDVAALSPGAFHWLGEYDIAPGDRLRYDVTAETGEVLQIGLAKEGDNSPTVHYCMVQAPRQEGELRITADFTVSANIPAGKYRLFVRGPAGAAAGVRGSVVFTLSRPPQSGSAEGSVVNITIDELPAAVRQVLGEQHLRRWYLIGSGGQQYLCFRGFAWSFGYAPARQGEGWRLEIQRFRKKDFGDLFLAIPGEGPVTVTCDGEPVAFTRLDA